MRKLIGTTTAVLAAAVLMLPATVSAGVVQFSGTWTDSPTSTFMGDFACTGQPSTVAGSGLTSGSFRVTETVKLGAHVEVAIEGSVTLYEASGSPSDPQLGAYVGTWTYANHYLEQWAPGGTAVFTSVAHGEIVFADGSTAMLKVSFILLEGPDGPKLFFAKAGCGGE